MTITAFDRWNPDAPPERVRMIMGRNGIRYWDRWDCDLPSWAKDEPVVEYVLSTRASEPASEVVERCAAMLDALLRTGDDPGAVYRNETIAQCQAAIRAIATPSSPDASRMGASEVERVTDVLRSTWLACGFTLPDDIDSAMPFLARDAIAALTPVSGHTDGTWQADPKTIEACISAMRRVENTHIDCAERIAAAVQRRVRNLSPRAASGAGE